MTYDRRQRLRHTRHQGVKVTQNWVGTEAIRGGMALGLVGRKEGHRKSGLDKEGCWRQHRRRLRTGMSSLVVREVWMEHLQG